MNFEIITNPWKNKFYQYVSDSNYSIDICSPFVKYDVIKKLYDKKKGNVEFNLVTYFNIANFYKKASDLKALNFILENNGKIINYQNLHAKIYIFDKKSVVVTSANMTNAGLEKNYEYGIFSNDKDLVLKVYKDYDFICRDESSGIINNEIVKNIENIIKSIPKDKRDFKIPKFNLNKIQKENVNQDEIYTGGIESIRKTLLGWKYEVFSKINELDKFLFTLEDVYGFKSYFQKKYPDNRNIEAKIRQQLQILRDLGIIKFIGSGRYQKLWV